MDRVLRQGHELRHGEIAKLERRLPRVEQEAHVGGGQTFCYPVWLHLNVVRDEPVIAFVTEGAEVMPSAERDLAEKSLLGTGQFRGLRVRRSVGPSGDEFGATPGDDERKCERCGLRPPVEPNREYQRQRRHPIQVDVYWGALPDAQFGLGGSLPFEQT